MATFAELTEIIKLTTQADQDLLEDVKRATEKAVVNIFEETPPPDTDPAATILAYDQRVQWAGRAIAEAENEGLAIFRLVVMSNSANSPTQIRDATDAQVQTRVDAIVQALARGTYIA